MTGGIADASIDGFLGGLVTLVQPRLGHRAGLDAALLQALVPGDMRGEAVDLGTGAGAVAFALAARAPDVRTTGVERDPQLVACAQAALAHPGNAKFASRARAVLGDVTASRPKREALGLADGAFNWVLMNPPFDAPGQGSPSPDAARRDAHVAAPGMLPAWIRTAAGLLKHRGRLGLIHRPSALPEILEELSARFGDIRIRPIHPRRDAPAGRVLVEARSGSRATMRILPGLVLHGADGSWTAEAEAVLRGRADLAA